MIAPGLRAAKRVVEGERQIEHRPAADRSGLVARRSQHFSHGARMAQSRVFEDGGNVVEDECTVYAPQVDENDSHHKKNTRKRFGLQKPRPDANTLTRGGHGGAGMPASRSSISRAAPKSGLRRKASANSARAAAKSCA